MGRYVKRPVEVEAVQLNALGRFSEFPEWVAYAALQGQLRYDEDSVVIKTLEGEMRGSPHDWIIRGVKGELYPCKPDIFRATYEAVPEVASGWTP